MDKNSLHIDARMLMASGIGTYLKNILKRVRFEQLGLEVTYHTYTDEATAWLAEHQPQARVEKCPYWIYGLQEQIYWREKLQGGAFWAPHYNIPWGGYEKLIVTVHDAFPLTSLAPWMLRQYGRLMYMRIRQQADAIITTCDFSQSELRARANILDTPIYITSLGVDPNWFTPVAQARPYKEGYYIYVGNMKPHKNLYRLLQAIEKLKPSQKLVCVGAYKNLKYADSRAYRLLQKMQDRVISTDHVDDERLRTLVKHADGLIMPSLYEGFGLPPLEAMAAGVPVLISDTASMPEVCGAHALYCDPYSVESIAEGIQRLGQLQGIDRDKWTTLASDHAARYNWDNTAKATMEIFRTVLA